LRQIERIFQLSYTWSQLESTTVGHFEILDKFFRKTLDWGPKKAKKNDVLEKSFSSNADVSLYVSICIYFKLTLKNIKELFSYTYYLLME